MRVFWESWLENSYVCFFLGYLYNLIVIKVYIGNFLWCIYRDIDEERWISKYVFWNFNLFIGGDCE